MHERRPVLIADPESSVRQGDNGLGVGAGRVGTQRCACQIEGRLYIGCPCRDRETRYGSTACAAQRKASKQAHRAALQSELADRGTDVGTRHDLGPVRFCQRPKMLQTVALDGRFDPEIGAAIRNRPDRSLRLAPPSRQARSQAERKPHAAALRQIDDTERDVAPRESLSRINWVPFGHSFMAGRDPRIHSVVDEASVCRGRSCHLPTRQM